MSPNVSINLCCYNSEKYLKEAIDSSLIPVEGFSFPKNIKLHDSKSFDFLGLNYLRLIEKLGKLY